MSAPDNHLNYARCQCMIQILIPRVMCQVHKWLYKGGRKSLKKYIESIGKMNKFDVEEEKKINDGASVSNMDVKLLYKVLQLTCGLAAEPEAWHKSPPPGQPLTLENALHRLKKYRNIRSHPDPQKMLKVSDADLKKAESELKSLFTQVLTLAGQKTPKTVDTAAAITSVMEALQRELSAPSTSRITEFDFASLGRYELKSKKMLTVLPANKYLEPRLLAEEHNATAPFSEMPCKDLFTLTCHDESRPKLLLLAGEMGAGKTSFCQHVVKSWLHCPDEMTSLGEYHLVLSLHCGQIKTRDLHYYLTNHLLPKTTKRCHDGAELTKIIAKLRILWVVDGWDEATLEARELVGHLLTMEQDTHTFLIASRPEASQELLNELPSQTKTVRLYFAKLSVPEKKQLIQKNINAKTNARDQQHMDRYIFNHEITTPLQLVLTARLAMEHKERKKGTHSLTQLYSAINKHQLENLIGKCKREVPPKLASATVDDFFKCVCNVAFDTVTNGPHLKLDKQSIKRLEEKCPYVTDSICFSTFFVLSEDPHETTNKSNQYSFPQQSERQFYATLHLRHICSKADNPEAELEKAFKLHASHPSEVHPQNIPDITPYHPVLLFVLEMITNESFGTIVSVQCLVNLFSKAIGENADPKKWFEVLRSGQFEDTLVQEVSKKVDLKLWSIADRDLKAVSELLKHVTPEEVIVDISGNTKDLPELDQTLSQLAQKSIHITLIFNRDFGRYDTENSAAKYLELLCNHKSKCQLVTFKGYLCKTSIKHLNMSPHLHSLKNLRVRVTSSYTVNLLARATQILRSLRSLKIICDFKRLDAPTSSIKDSLSFVLRISQWVGISFGPFQKPPEVDLSLPHLHDGTVKFAIGFISKFSQNYRTISVGHLGDKGLKELESGLAINGVKVDRPIRVLKRDTTARM